MCVDVAVGTVVVCVGDGLFLLLLMLSWLLRVVVVGDVVVRAFAFAIFDIVVDSLFQVNIG